MGTHAAVEAHDLRPLTDSQQPFTLACQQFTRPALQCSLATRPHDRRTGGESLRTSVDGSVQRTV
jgi:hypothetical protein